MILGETLNQKRIRVRQCYSSNPEVMGFEYDATESPCERVIERKDCCYPAGVQALFPDHPLVRKLGAEGYIGIPLCDRDNNPMGLLTVLHDTPLKAPDIALPLCNLLALRISAELERIRTEQILRQSEQFFRKVAFIDQLTGLCNRLLLMRRLEHARRGSAATTTNWLCCFSISTVSSKSMILPVMMSATRYWLRRRNESPSASVPPTRWPD